MMGESEHTNKHIFLFDNRYSIILFTWHRYIITGLVPLVYFLWSIYSIRFTKIKKVTRKPYNTVSTIQYHCPG